MGKLEQATLGGGCFWCLDAAYQLVKGVAKVVSGYAGGQAPNPTYEQVCGGQTGHAEVVQVTFNLDVISYADILDIFWALHDPTTPNRQGNDVGTQYRSVIFYQNEDQRKIAEKSKAEVQKLWQDPVVTEISPLPTFYPAEEIHQGFFQNHPEAAYCQVIINPKLQKLREKYTTLLKS